MIKLTAEVIILGIGSVISPGIIAVSVILLSSRYKPLLKSVAFLLGNVLTLLILLTAGYFIGNGVGSTLLGRFFDIGFGLLFLFLAVMTYYQKKDNERKIKKEQNVTRFWLWLFVGFLISITNFDAETLYLVAMNEIFESGISRAKEIMLAGYLSIMIILPALLPILVFVIFPKKARHILEVLRRYVNRYSRITAICIFVVMGLWFVWKGITG